MAQLSDTELHTCTLFAILCSCVVVMSEVLDNAGTTQRPPTEFTRRTIITPKLFHGRVKREIESTHSSVEGGHIRDLTIDYDVNGTRYILDMRLNEELVSERFRVYYRRNGQDVVEPIGGKDTELCDYQGRVRGREDSWAAVSTCRGISGVVFDGDELFYLEPGFGAAHFLYRHSDITTNRTCGTLQAQHYIEEKTEAKDIFRLKRNSPVIRGPYNADNNSRYVELELVVDHQIYVSLGRSRAKVHHHCKELVNIVNRLYQPLNIFIVLIGIVIWTERDEISLSRDSLNTLENFVSYREKRLMDGYHSDNGQLLTLVKFDNDVVGKAFIQTICQLQKSSGINVKHSSLSGLVAQTVAHEMGHNFGMDHDKDSCNCNGCLMAASSNNMVKTEWSYCSMNYLADTFKKGKDFCLKNKPIRMLDSPVCGNGFVESGEQCDCGLPDVCKNPCCDASSCKLLSSASCATGECCDLQTCHFKSGGNLCRSTEQRECDLPEYCTGNGEYCPDDVFKMDGLTCDQGEAFCHHGDCPSRGAQCRVLWGPNSQSAELCYEKNTEGDRYKNCGYDQQSKMPIRCKEKDVKCGRLQCAHTNHVLLTDSGVETQRWWTLDGRRSIDCRAVAGSPGLGTFDLGLVPNGAKCGDDKICVSQKCVPLSTLQQRPCSMDCNGNGVCNSKGNCHCDASFAPPFCNTPGFGGSLDSGVVKDLSVFKYYTITLYVVFLGIIPLSVLVLLIVNCKRHQHSRKKTRSKSPHLCNDSYDCCCSSLCNQFHTYVLCGGSSHELDPGYAPPHPGLTQDSGNALPKNQSYVGQMPHKPADSINVGKVPQQKGLVSMQKGNLSGNSTMSSVHSKTYRMSFNERLKRFNSIKKWKTGVVEMSVINLPGLNAGEHKSNTSGNTKSREHEFGIEFHPKTSSYMSKPTHVQNKKLFFESQDQEGPKRTSSEHTQSKDKLFRKNSKGLQLNVAAAKTHSARTKILKTDESDLSTPETPPVEKYLRSMRGTTKEPVKKEGRGLSNPSFTKTPPPPPPSALKPRF